jgi:hypothetical protein
MGKKRFFLKKKFKNGPEKLKTVVKGIKNVYISESGYQEVDIKKS